MNNYQILLEKGNSISLNIVGLENKFFSVEWGEQKMSREKPVLRI